MKDFRFFRGYGSSTLNTIEGETYGTASFHTQTPEGVMGRRRLYHTNLPEYQRLREDQVITHQQYNLNRDMLAIEQSVRFAQQRRESRMLELREIEENANRMFFPRTTVTTVNPKWWMKIKMFYQKFKYNSVIETNSEMLGIFVITTSITLGVGFIIAKILNIW